VRAIAVLMLTMVVVAVGLTPRVDAGSAAPGKLKIGVLNGMFRDVPPAILQVTARPFSDLFKKQTGLEAEVEVFPDCDALAAKMTAKELHIGVFHGYEYAWIKDAHPEVKPAVITIPPGGKCQAILVVNKADKAQTPADLQGSTVVVPMFTKAHCHLYLERLQAELPANAAQKAKHGPITPEEALDAVVDGTRRCALVDIASLSAYENSKPGNFLVLRELSKSDFFPPAVIAYRKDVVPAQTVNQIRDGLLKAHTTSQGKAFMMLWKLRGFAELPEGFNAHLERIAKAYPPTAAPVMAMPPN
jgi:ABC-type phosphate/phosphonate transport system substrate-binding protein